MRCVSDNASRTSRIKKSLAGRSLRQTEVEKDDVILVRQLQILRFDVAMNDWRLVRVKIRKRIEKLICPEHHPANRERLLSNLQPFREIVSRDVLHYEILLFAFTEMIRYLR